MPIRSLLPTFYIGRSEASLKEVVVAPSLSGSVCLCAKAELVRYIARSEIVKHLIHHSYYDCSMPAKAPLTLHIT